jgi:signal transduction histidine kinase
MDGYDFFHAVRARSEWTSIPFIFLTAMTGRRDVIKGKALGAEDYLTKPVDPEELVVTIRARLARAQSVQKSAEEKLDEIKRQIVTTLGHELRTPLTYIRGYTELALDDVPNLSSEMLQEFLQAISQGAERLQRVSNDFLLLTRLDTGLMAGDFRQLARVCDDWHVVAERVLREYEEPAVVKGMVLEAEIPSKVPPVNLCEFMFEDALGRLVGNAIKFSGRKGKRVTVSVKEDREWAHIGVADEGVGIPAEAIPHLFERFRQIDRETQEQQGVGLGLALARELIRLHGGEIDVESTVGEGSVFTIRLPIVKVSETERFET